MLKKIPIFDFVKNYFILIIIAAQPVLDIIAYYTDYQRSVIIARRKNTICKMRKTGHTF